MWPFKKKTEDNIEKNNLLREQKDCPHAKTRVIRSLEFNYGIGIICDKCAKEMKNEEEKMYDEMFPNRHKEEKERQHIQELKEKHDILNSWRVE